MTIMIIRLLVSALTAVIHLILSPITLALSVALLVGAWWISRQVSRPRGQNLPGDLTEWTGGPPAEWLGA